MSNITLTSKSLHSSPVWYVNSRRQHFITWLYCW